jgi:cyanophycin synthetase
MNLFKLGNYHALLDYAHNPHSYKALGSFVLNWQGQRIGVVGAPGDRRDEDFVTLGKLSAEMFDRIIVKEDIDRRGREPGVVAQLICQGIAEAISAGTANKSQVAYELILDETTAVNKALDEAPAGSLVVILPESVNKALSLIEARKPIKESVEVQNGLARSKSQESLKPTVVNQG